MTRNVPINKGNYSMDTPEREALFEAYRGEGWEEEYADYRRKWTSQPKNQIVSDYPLLVDVELASVSKLRCPMCYTITEKFKEHVDATLMEWELYRKIIDEIGGKVPALRLSLHGEATLHKRFLKCVSYTKEHGIKEVSSLTHGGRLTLPFFIEIAKAGIDWITISIDGAGEVYESIRTPIKFATLVENIKAIHCYKVANNLHRPVIKIQGIWPANRNNPQQYYSTLAPISDLVAFNPLIDYLGNDTEADIQYVEHFICPQQYQRLVIRADGLAMKYSNDEENQEVVGDLKQQTVHEIWHGPRMAAAREMRLRPQGFLESAVCRKCYLPRVTEDEEAEVDGRRFIVRNYVSLSQEIGK
ncbi:MAG: radical SAM protein [Rhodomicrobium sp.]